MISPVMVKIISKMPDGMVRFIASKLLNGYIDKYANMKIEGMENIQDLKKPAIFICNHLSNADALVLNKVLKSQNMTFVAGVKLSSNPLTGLGIRITKTIPIKPNTADKEAISKIIRTLKEGNNILMFPEGTRSRTGSLIEAKKGIYLIQKLSKATVVPVAMTGTENLLPIDDKDMGAEKFQSADVTVTIGKPLDLPKREEGEEKHAYEDRMVDFFMKGIAELLPEKYRGIYK